MSILNDGVNT
jgi:hypothetical protein